LQHDRFDGKDVTRGDDAWFVVFYPDYTCQIWLGITAEGIGEYRNLEMEDELWNITHGGQWKSFPIPCPISALHVEYPISLVPYVGRVGPLRY